jgi:alpha-beta hydrolase superfamily lysophospholipase
MIDVDEATFLPAEVQAMHGWLHSFGFTAAVAAFACLAPGAAAQNNFEKVRIKTVDGVDLSGRFYPGSGETPPVVLLLHGLKENSNSKEWTSLAKALQAKKFAVLTFDFRGCGSGTTEVDPALFWAPENRLNQLIRGRKESISSKEFKPEYYPALINDIAAAKAFLDRRNDGNAGGARCNSSNLVLIGSREGAALGAIWLNAEWHRYKVKTNPMGQPIIQNGFNGPEGLADAQQPPAGSSVVGALWLSITPKLLGPRMPSLPLDSILLTAAKKQYVPMAFMYGDEDVPAKKIARSLEAKLVVYKKLKGAKGKREPEDKYKFTGAWAIEKTKLDGVGLLAVPEMVDKVVEWVDNVAQAKSNEWVEQDFRKTPYVWLTAPPPAGVPVYGQLAKPPMELHLKFSDYHKFMR